MAQKTTRTDSSKIEEAFPITGSMTTAEISAAEISVAEISVKVPQVARQEYPEVNAAIDRGLADVAAGRVHRMSFAEYADIPTED